MLADMVSVGMMGRGQLFYECYVCHAPWEVKESPARNTDAMSDLHVFISSPEIQRDREVSHDFQSVPQFGYIEISTGLKASNKIRRTQMILFL